MMAANTNTIITVLGMLALCALSVYTKTDVQWAIVALAGAHGGTQAATAIGGK